MDNHKNNEVFSYTYSAREQAEIRKIREKYTNKEEDKMKRLRRLDAGVTQKAQAVSLTLGILGTLILGFGMSLIMSDLPDILGAYKELSMVVGILIGIVGGGFISLAYPIYHFILKRERKKIAPEILRLTDELMK
ncbi:MAG: hypothetical protein IJ489_09425 [Clostridia bacterium]|nr:hypothetical protein [Clostridia bacterium]